MTPSDPRHGTRRGYNAGCDCDDCKHAHSMYCKTYRLRRARSGGESVTVPTHGPHYYLDCTTGRYVHA